MRLRDRAAQVLLCVVVGIAAYQGQKVLADETAKRSHMRLIENVCVRYLSVNIEDRLALKQRIYFRFRGGKLSKLGLNLHSNIREELRDRAVFLRLFVIDAVVRYKFLVRPIDMSGQGSLDSSCWRFACIQDVKTEPIFFSDFDINGATRISKCGRKSPYGTDPSPLIFLQGIDAGLQSSLRALLLDSIASLGFSERLFRCCSGITRSVGGRLGYGGLPDSDSTASDGREDKYARKQGYPSIRFDLLTCELVLLIFASAAGCLFLVLRGIKKESVTFLTEMGYVALFVVGQLAVYLLCRRIYGL